VTVRRLTKRVSAMAGAQGTSSCGKQWKRMANVEGEYRRDFGLWQRMATCGKGSAQLCKQEVTGSIPVGSITGSSCKPSLSGIGRRRKWLRHQGNKLRLVLSPVRRAESAARDHPAVGHRGPAGVCLSIPGHPRSCLTDPVTPLPTRAYGSRSRQRVHQRWPARRRRCVCSRLVRRRRECVGMCGSSRTGSSAGLR
jgi:hypothetical protein